MLQCLVIVKHALHVQYAPKLGEGILFSITTCLPFHLKCLQSDEVLLNLINWAEIFYDPKTSLSASRP